MEIDKYIASLTKLSEQTRCKYLLCLNKINKEISLKEAVEIDLWTYIENTDTKLKTKRDKQFVVKGYRKFCKLETSYFTAKLKKSDTGEYINSENQVKEDKEIKQLPANYKELIDAIENNLHKLILRLLTEYQEVLRTDLAFVKISDIINGVITIKETQKTKMQISIKLKPEELELIDFDKEYLIEINAKDRSNSYTSLVKRITKKYFGIELTQTFFRHLASTTAAKSIEHLPLREQQVLLKEQALKRAHSANVAISHYIDEVNDINVSMKYKKTINILDNENKVIERVDIIEMLKAMKLYKVIKESLS